MREWSQRRRLSVALGLNLAMIAGLVAVGLVAGSLGVLSAAADFAADSVALLLGLVAVTVRDRRHTDRSKRSRATTVVALINGVALLVVSVVVLVEGVDRLRSGAPVVLGVPVLVVSLISAAVMLLGASVLGWESGGEDLHMRSVLLDTVADAAAAFAVGVAGAVMALLHGWYWLDPVFAGVIAVVVAVAAVKLLRDAARDLTASAGEGSHDRAG